MDQLRRFSKRFDERLVPSLQVAPEPGGGGYCKVSWRQRGTTVTLKLRDDAGEFVDEHRVRELIRKYSDHIAFPVLLRRVDADGSEETVNRAKALWARPRSEIGEEPRAYIHRPAGRSQSVQLIVRTSTPGLAALPMLREAIWALEPNVVFTSDLSAAEVAAATMAPTTIGAGLIGSFGALALLLASVGLYGVVAYSVSLRTREVGIRMALGAQRGQVLRHVLGQGGRLALAGVILGAIGAAVVGRVLASLLYGVSPFDPPAYAFAAGLLFVVATLANLAPALTAAHIDPLKALRRD